MAGNTTAATSHDQPGAPPPETAPSRSCTEMIPMNLTRPPES